MSSRTDRQLALGTPARIERRRAKGWRAPHGAVYVGRGTRWGNPYVVAQLGQDHAVVDSHTSGVIFADRSETEARRVACNWYRAWLSSQPGLLAAVRRQLSGHDLMCWCPLPEPGQPDHCHAAVLLARANDQETNRV
ncbi:DUF4326 domain-containing protein [Streptomyces sp. NBC_00645]|uniref:DUF4326 domain-containing protein n=1 Tax=Streptomyces sp. NBC_00645 TaxID=2975795 RepID=UPI00324C2CFC